MISRGSILHSSGQSDDLDVKGKRVLVVGVGTSGHDIAQDMHLRGAARHDAAAFAYHRCQPRAELGSRLRDVSQERGRPPARRHRLHHLGRALRSAAAASRAAQPADAEEDKELLDGLRKVGFLLDNGEDDTGYFLKLLRYQAGYYLNVGASDLIIEGKIKLKAGVGIERLTKRQAMCSRTAAAWTWMCWCSRPAISRSRKRFGRCSATMSPTASARSGE